MTKATVIKKAKDFAEAITSFNQKKKGLKSKRAISLEYAKNSRNVRQVLAKNGIHRSRNA